MLSDSSVSMHFNSLSDAQDATGFIEAWDWLCKAVRKAPPDRATLSDTCYFVSEDQTDSNRSIYLSGQLGWTPLPKSDHNC